jgi:hypothetical protein
MNARELQLRLEDRVVANHAFADDDECTEDMLGSEAFRRGFTIGALCGFVAGIIALGVPAMILAAIIA